MIILMAKFSVSFLLDCYNVKLTEIVFIYHTP